MKRFLFFTVVFNLFSLTLLGQWSTSNLSVPRSLLTSTAHNGKIYVSGGATYSQNQIQSTVDILDIATLTWSTAALSEARFVLASTATNNQVIVGGGVINLTTAEVSDRVDIYTPSTATWTTSSLSQQRGALTATSNGDKAIFAGGITNFGSGITSDVVDIYDSTTGQWSTGQLSAPRGYLTSTTLDNKAYIAAGISSISGAVANVSDKVDVYDYQTGIWSTESLSVPRGGVAAAAYGDYVLFAGGHDPNYVALNTVDIYNIATGTWSTATLSEARGELTAVALQGKIYFAGGYSNYSTLTMSDRVDIYDTQTGTWSTASLSTARSELTSASFGNTLVISGGGSYGSSLEFDTVDIYGDGSLGLAETNFEHEISIVPNPANSTLEVRAPFPIDTLEIFSADSLLIKRYSNIEKYVVELDASFLSTGVYYLRVTSQGEIMSGKFTKK